MDAVSYTHLKAESTKKKSKHNGHYDTPKELGKKWQMDVKYVPSACYAGEDGEKFYQYTMLEEVSRKRFIYAYRETGGYSTCDFVKRAIIWFGYAPDTIQTDNGGEFTHTKKKQSAFIRLTACAQNCILPISLFAREHLGTMAKWSAATAMIKNASTITLAFALTEICKPR